MVPKGKKKPQGKIDKVKLLNALLDGKTKVAAARIAGSKAKTKQSLCKITEDAKKDPLFAELLERGIPDSLLVKRIRDGVDAKRSILVENVTINDKGQSIKKTKVLKIPDLGMRLNYLDRVIDLKSLKPQKNDTPVGVPGAGIFIKIDQILNEYGTSKSGGSPNPYR